MAAPGLLDHLADFVRALRSAGVPVGVSEGIDAAAVLGAVDVLDRRQLRAGLATVVVKRPVYRPTYDALFDLWWPARMGDGANRPDVDATPVDPEALRDELMRLLLDGDEEALRRFAREAVATLGGGDAGDDSGHSGRRRAGQGEAGHGGGERRRGPPRGRAR